MADLSGVVRTLNEVVAAVESVEYTFEIQAGTLLTELEKQTRLLNDIAATLDSIDTELSLK